MNPYLKNYFGSSCEKKIGNFLVKWDGETYFLVFEPGIIFCGEYITRILVRNSTTKHFEKYAIELLFNKLIPSIEGKTFKF
ncbi:hypothetical protein ACFLZV_07100, partial [Candidatus Margulisiibacteriota bacterium]